MMKTAIQLIICTILLGIGFSKLAAQQIDPPSLQLEAGPADTSTAKLSPRLQRALEVDSVTDDLQGIVVLCANACEPKSSSAVRKPMQDIKNAPARSTRPAPRHDTGMAIIRKVGALSCTGAAGCVDLIARKGSCKVGTVTCNAGGCRCEAK